MNEERDGSSDIRSSELHLPPSSEFGSEILCQKDGYAKHWGKMFLDVKKGKDGT